MLVVPLLGQDSQRHHGIRCHAWQVSHTRDPPKDQNRTFPAFSNCTVGRVFVFSMDRKRARQAGL